ncbi:MAG: hypothetical protein D6704_06215 [Nitrospirae bacterium]|nr:MAG: hypothetical protein D6704_06215 [Nitrospirota bacterium]
MSPHSTPEPHTPPPSEKPASKKTPTPRKEIPLMPVPQDEASIAEEMAEIFEEDRVTHQHGSTEPEGE